MTSSKVRDAAKNAGATAQSRPMDRCVDASALGAIVLALRESMLMPIDAVRLARRTAGEQCEANR